MTTPKGTSMLTFLAVRSTTISRSIHITSRCSFRGLIKQIHNRAKQKIRQAPLIGAQTHSYPRLYCPRGRNHPARHDTNLAFRPTLITRHFSESQSIKMSDEDYTAFLNKANKDYSAPSAQHSAAQETGISATANETLKAIGERWYTSDSDEPFTDVTFGWEGDALPDRAEFGGLVGLEVSEKMPYSEWDVSKSYEDVTSAVKGAAGGSAPEVYKVEESGTKKWYYIIALDKKNRQLVGLRALAIES